MTDFTQLSDKELSEALGFHRRQRNMSRNLNESAHMRQTQVVRLLEAEEARRLEEAEAAKPAYHYYVTKNDIGPGKKKLTHSKAKPFATERDAFEHILKSGGRQSGIIHKAHAESGKIIQNRGVDSGQRGYPSSVSGDDPLHVKDLKEEVEQIDENGIKGWKHAASDIAKMRSAQGKNIKLVSLKKDGTESKMHDAAKMFRSEDEAQEHHDRVTKLNPKSKIRHNLYVDGKHVKTLGESIEQIDEISKDTLHSYWKKAAVARAPLDAKARKADTQRINRIRSGKPLDGYKPKDELTPDEKRVRTNRSKGMDRAGHKLFRSEEVELDEASKEHLERLKTMLDKAKPGSADHSQIRHAISSMYGDAHIPAKHKNVKPDMYEEVELDENIAGKFKDASEWERAAKSRGLVVKSMTHPSGETTKYQIAKDKEGNNRGHFDHGTKSGHLKEEVEQIDEISTELKKRYVEKGADDVVDRFTSRGKYERPYDPSKYTKTGRPKKSAVNSPESVKYRAKLDSRRDIVNKVSQEVHGKKRFGEEVEVNEASDLRITKVYNKWPKKATYAVHTPDRKYFKEFDSMEAAKAHHDEKTNNK